MSRDSESRRAWIKNAAIIFLVILLLLTFFSNTILNYTLPEVSAQYAQYGTIAASVKVTGTVKANESYNVMYEADQAEAENGTIQSRKVVSVYVKEGDTVAKDTPIIALQGGASTQLEAAQAEYDKLKREYDLALLQDVVDGLNSDNTLSKAEQAIADKKKELAELNAEYTAVLGGVDTTSVIEARIETLEDGIEYLNDLIAAQSEKVAEIKGKIQSAEGMIEEDIFSTLTVAEKLAIAEEEYTVLEQTYNELTANVETLKADMERIESSSGDIGKANTLTNEIRSLESQLESLELERERYIEDFYASLNDEDYNELLDAYEEAKEKYENYKDENDEVISQLETLIETRDTYQETVNEHTTLVQNISSAESELKSAQDLLKIAKANNVEGDVIAELDADVTLCNDILTGAKAELAQFESGTDIESVKKKLADIKSEITVIQGYADGLSSYELTMTNAKKALDAYNPIEIDYTKHERKLEDYESQISDLERKISDAYEKLDVIGLPEVDDVVNYATDYDLAEAKRKYDEANTSLTEVTAKYEEAKTKVESLRKQNTADGMVSEYTILLNTYQAELDSLEAQLKQKNKELEAARKELSGAETPPDPEDIRKQIEEAEKSIVELEAQLEITKATENKSGQTTDFERADQLKKLDELQKKIEEYKNAPENVSVTAPIAGRIVSVDVVPGDTVTSGNTVARIEIADKGYICEITMSAEEARKIQVGAPCTISNSWWYSEVSASVTQIRSDPQSQGKNRIVVITVNGDVYEGQSLSFTIGDRNQSYDCVLPNSAIREDNDGKFVLTVTSKKTPLGVRYTAVRTNIEVLASDDTKSAVSGLYGSEFVITNATSPISDKQQVRLADENG